MYLSKGVQIKTRSVYYQSVVVQFTEAQQNRVRSSPLGANITHMLIDDSKLYPIEFFKGYTKLSVF